MEKGVPSTIKEEKDYMICRQCLKSLDEMMSQHAYDKALEQIRLVQTVLEGHNYPDIRARVDEALAVCIPSQQIVEEYKKYLDLIHHGDRVRGYYGMEKLLAKVKIHPQKDKIPPAVIGMITAVLGQGD